MACWFFLFLFVLILPVIHDPANRRFRISGDLDEVQAFGLGQDDSLLWRHHAKLLTVSSDDSNLTNANPFVDPCGVFLRRTDSESRSRSSGNAALLSRPLKIGAPFCALWQKSQVLRRWHRLTSALFSLLTSSIGAPPSPRRPLVHRQQGSVESFVSRRLEF